MPTFGFGEAYCLMWYACECGHRERIWNSRDGITPFSIGCPSCGELMRHVEWRADMPSEHHELHPFQRYFRDGTPDDAERIMRRRIETCPTGDPEYDKELIEYARKGDGEFRPGWPMLDIHLPHEAQHSEPGRVDDTARLDKLERLGDPGVPWIARQSSRGRGYRLHQSWSHAAVQPTVREAIDAAPEPEGEGG